MKQYFRNSMIAMFVIAAISAISLHSCKKDPTLSITPQQSAIAFTADGTTADNTAFAVITNQSTWDAVSSQTWCRVTKTATGFTVSADANTATAAPAPATVTVTAGKATSIVINVTQAAAGSGATLSISPQQTSIAFAADGTTSDNTAFTVATNTGAWEVAASAGQTWCTAVKNAEGTGFTVSATENVSTTAPAPATVTVTAGEATPIVINVTQAAASNVTDFTVTAGNVSFDMVAVEGGAITLNGTSVTISSFSIGKYEVTQGLWMEVMGAWPGTAPEASRGLGDNYPAYYVSWDDIVGTSSSGAGYAVNGVTYYKNGFCYRLSQLVGGGRQFRLPTEAEWEYAARGGQQTHNYEYSGSNTVGDVAWYDGNSYALGRGHADYGAHSAGTKAANELGIYDMSGNVWEWCSDRHGSVYPSSADNPIGASSGSHRMRRGGSWLTLVATCRVSYRDYSPPNNRHGDLGFRLACSSN